MALSVNDERDQDDDDEGELRQAYTGEHRHLPESVSGSEFTAVGLERLDETTYPSQAHSPHRSSHR